MSTSILYHAFGIKGIHYESTSYEGDAIVISARLTDQHIKCPECGHRKAAFKGHKRRKILLSPMGRKRCYLDLLFHRLKCRECGKLWWPAPGFLDGKHRYARSFALTVLDLLGLGTISSVARYLRVGWDLIKEIHKSKLSRTYKTIPLQEINCVGIDEFSIKKGHEYMTIFTDLESGRIIHAVKGRAKEDIQPFLERLCKKAKNLKAIAMDMSGAYYHAVREALPRVDIVFDHYHVAALVNQAIDELRREQQRELDELGKKTLKGSRFLLLKNYDDLSVDRKERLHNLLAVNEPLFTAHCMKEQLRLFWEQPNPESARHFLETWCKDARESGIKVLAGVGKTLSGYRTGLLNYFKHRISNAMTEGLNNKIKTLKRQAYGFRDMEYFILRLYHLHTQRYSLTG